MADRYVGDDETREVEPARGTQTRAVGSRDTATAVDRGAQHEEYGGFNFGAAFFGWLVAVGITALLTALLSAAGAAIGLTQVSDAEAQANAETISIVGGVLLIIVVAIGYYAGGYVAGRMSRFDGGRQGFGAWAIGLIVTIALAAAGAIAGSEYNLLGDLDLPRIPIDEGSLATGAGIALAAILVASLIAAVLGGKAGQRYHRKVDAAGRPGELRARRQAAA
jgi:hypothetical protein